MYNIIVKTYSVGSWEYYSQQSINCFISNKFDVSLEVNIINQYIVNRTQVKENKIKLISNNILLWLSINSVKYEKCSHKLINYIGTTIT